MHEKVRIAIRNEVWEDCYDYYPAMMHTPFSKTVSTTWIQVMFHYQLLPIVTVEAAGFHSNLVSHVILHINFFKCSFQFSSAARVQNNCQRAVRANHVNRIHDVVAC